MDLLAITETWLTPGKSSEVLNTICPAGYSHVSSSRSHGGGGGIALIYKKNVSVKKIDCLPSLNSFEYLDLRFRLSSVLLRLIIIYRPPSSSTSDFINDFATLLESVVLVKEKLVLLGDFNFWVDSVSVNPAARTFTITLTESFGLTQLVNEPTHIGGHTLDLILTRSGDPVISNVGVASLLSDHRIIQCSVRARPPRWPIKRVISRSLRKINIEALLDDVALLPLLSDPAYSLDKLVSQYNDGLRELLDLHAPLREREIILRPANRWMNADIKQSRTELRRAERRYRTRGLHIDLEIYQHRLKVYNKLLRNSKTSFIKSVVDENRGDKRALFRLVGDLMGNSKEQGTPSTQATVDDFGSFFSSKVSSIVNELKASSLRQPTESTTTTTASPNNDKPFAEFSPLSIERIRILVETSPTKSCSLDPIPTQLLKQLLPILVQPITKIVNESITSGAFPSSLKHAAVTPLLKKPGSDTSNPANYRPVSNLPFLAKLIERAVHAQLMEHLTQSNLLPERQSAYRPYHSTKTVLLSIFNDLLLSGDEGLSTILLLLDLCAAFDTLDHAIFLERLEFHCRVSGKALAWFASFLKERTPSPFI